MARKTKKTESAADIGLQLAEVRSRIAQEEELNKALTEAFKRACAVEGIKKAGGYKVSPVKTFTVVAPELAMQFALQRNAVKVDTALVKDIFSLDATLRFKDPTEYGFGEKVTNKVVPVKSHEE